jgi:hypothetical protein
MSRDRIPLVAGLAAGLVPLVAFLLIQLVTGCAAQPSGPTCPITGTGAVLLWVILGGLGGLAGGVLAASPGATWRGLRAGLAGWLAYLVIVVILAFVRGGMAGRETETAYLGGVVLLGFLAGFGVVAVITRTRRA